MMKKCPECGSTEIVPDLIVFADESAIGQRPLYVSMIEPDPEKRPFIWSPKIVSTAFRAAICGACGHTQFYTKYHAEMLEAHKKGYTSQQYGLKTFPAP